MLPRATGRCWKVRPRLMGEWVGGWSAAPVPPPAEVRAAAPVGRPIWLSGTHLSLSPAAAALDGPGSAAVSSQYPSRVRLGRSARLRVRLGRVNTSPARGLSRLSATQRDSERISTDWICSVRLGRPRRLAELVGPSSRRRSQVPCARPARRRPAGDRRLPPWISWMLIDGTRCWSFCTSCARRSASER